MEMLNFRRIFWSVAAAGFLSGCGGAGGSVTPNASAPAHPDRGRSWMDASAKNEALLYVSDSKTYDVYVYSYPKGKLVGTLTGQNNPGGMCVDKKGDVFVTQLYGGGHIVEYAHGGTTALESLSDPGYEPGGCSVDFSTGNLAVSNIINDSFDVGNLLIFRKAKGTPMVIDAPPQSVSGGEWGSVNTCAYDGEGNIFIAGHGYPDANVFAEVPKNSAKMVNVTLDQNFGNGIGNVQWDGSHITFADIVGDVYAFLVKNAKGKEVGATLVRNSDQVDYGWIEGKTYIAPQQFAADVLFYKYPAGGKSVEMITGMSAPFGVTVSPAQ